MSVIQAEEEAWRRLQHPPRHDETTLLVNGAVAIRCGDSCFGSNLFPHKRKQRQSERPRNRPTSFLNFSKCIRETDANSTTHRADEASGDVTSGENQEGAKLGSRCVFALEKQKPLTRTVFYSSHFKNASVADFHGRALVRPPQRAAAGIRGAEEAAGAVKTKKKLSGLSLDRQLLVRNSE